MGSEEGERKISHKKFYLQVILLLIFIFVLFYLYFLFDDLGIHPLVSVLLLLFVFLITISLFLRKNKGSSYSRLFPETKSKSSLNNIKEIIEQKESEQSQSKIFKPINLDSKHYKPIVLKCNNCKNIIPNFVKKCPFCNKEINR